MGTIAEPFSFITLSSSAPKPGKRVFVLKLARTSAPRCVAFSLRKKCCVLLREFYACFFDLFFFFFRFGLPDWASGFRIDWVTNGWPHFLICSTSKPSDDPISLVLAAQAPRDACPPFSLLNNCMVALASSILECCPLWISIPSTSLANFFKPGVLPVGKCVISTLPFSGKPYLLCTYLQNIGENRDIDLCP